MLFVARYESSPFDVHSYSGSDCSSSSVSGELLYQKCTGIDVSTFTIISAELSQYKNQKYENLSWGRCPQPVEEVNTEK